MTSEFTALESPLDAIRLIHKALRSRGAMVAQIAEQAGAESSLQAFRCAFDSWASGLLYFFEQEDALMSPAALEAESSRPGAKSVTQLEHGGLAHKVKREMAAANGRGHLELTEMLEEVLTVLNGEIQRTSIIQRTRQHLCQRVLSLRLALDDHLEDEETFLLPMLRRSMSEDRQREVVRRLLYDEESPEPHWIMNWVAEALTPGERQLLAGLELNATSAT
ncbi:MAG: hemerythrin domain-containing protein [Chloroflexi bacterium]|nr:hemerythrin domain-containing protein [Chloroflexota bacterium]